MRSRSRPPVLPRVGTIGTIPTTRATHRSRRDPGGMSPGDRLAEFGAILAAGYRRLVLRGKALDESGEPEALCRQAVNGNGAKAAEEVA